MGEREQREREEQEERRKAEEERIEREKAARRRPSFQFNEGGLSDTAIHNLMNPYDDRGYDGLYMMEKPKFSQLAHGLGFDVSEDKDDYYGNAKMSVRQHKRKRLSGLGFDRKKFRNRVQNNRRRRPFSVQEKPNPNDPDYHKPNRFLNSFNEPPNRNRKRFQDRWFQNRKDMKDWRRPMKLVADEEPEDKKEEDRSKGGRRDRDKPQKETTKKIEYNNPDNVVYGPGNLKPKVRPALGGGGGGRPNFANRRPFGNMPKKTRGNLRRFPGGVGRPFHGLRRPTMIRGGRGRLNK